MTAVVVAVLSVGASRPVLETVDGELSTFQRMVGGYVESLRLNRAGLALWFDEDGLRHGWAMNWLASAFAQRRIVGTALIVRSDANGNLVDVTSATLDVEGWCGQ